MPDIDPSAPQASAAEPNSPESGVSPSTETEQSTATKTNDTSAESKPMSAEEAEAILNQADNTAKSRRSDPLDDPEDHDPLADPEERDPLDTGLDDILDEEEETPTHDEAEGTTTEGEEEGTEEETPAPESEKETETEEDDGPKRIRLNLEQMNHRDRAIVLHARKHGTSLRDAEIALFGEVQPAAAKNDPEKSEPEAEQETPEQVTAEIEQLKAKRRTAAEAFDSKAQNDLTEQIEAAQERLFEARARQSSARTAFESAYSESKERAFQAYPDAFKPGNPLHDDIQKDVTRLEQVNPAFFNDPEWPETLVYKHAGKRGLKAATETPKAEEKAATPKPKAKVLPVKPARPVPGPASVGRTQESQSSEDSFRARIKAAEAKGDSAEVDRIIKELEGLGKRAA